MLSVLMRLNVATRRWHASADEPWLRLLQPGARREDYRAELVRMYGYQAPLDSACAYTPSLVNQRRLNRTGLIVQDLLTLGMSSYDISRLPQCPAITMFDEPLEALGWLYITERATLLHDRIQRQVTASLELGRACTYISGVDGQVGENWHHFGLVLQRVAPQAEQQNRIIDAAHAAFACLLEWPGEVATGRRAG